MIELKTVQADQAVLGCDEQSGRPTRAGNAGQI